MPNENEAAREIISSRVVDFSPDKVFTAWSDPGLLAQWWGPKGFTNTFHEFNFVPGGDWKFIMHNPDGTDYPNECVFDEIEAPHRIVVTHLRPMHKFQVTATFQHAADKTNFIFRMLFDSAEECQPIKAFITEANEQNLDRLEEVLEKNFR